MTAREAESEDLRSRLDALAGEAGGAVFDFVPPTNSLPLIVPVRIPLEADRPDTIELCRRLGVVLRAHIPDREGKWAWALYVLQSGPPIGFFWGGWRGRDDRWTDPDWDRARDPEG